MTTAASVPTVVPDRDQVARFDDDGFIVLPGVLSGDEIDLLRKEFAALQAGGPIPGHFEPKPADEADAAAATDPLHAYPRVMNPHRINPTARRYLLDARFRAVVAALLREEPLAAQSMFYFKPPGARGQALHQDNFYLRVEPGTCIAAWVAIDEIDRANGGLEVVPGTHRMDVFCPEDADPDVSFTREFVAPPAGLATVPVDMSPGDVLFFNGSLVHGSEPNQTADRFRRSFICHYIGTSSERMSTWYQPLTMSGDPVELAATLGGGPCGTEVGGPH
jgi:ectoine hydroxylase-related dioxygenase (phytanoyl-CoA dioxygenase family)